MKLQAGITALAVGVGLFALACEQAPTEPLEIAQPSAPSFSVVTTPPITLYYGDFLSTDWELVGFPQRWDVTACELTLSYGIEMNGIVGWTNWMPIQVGLREPTAPNLDPHYQAGWMQANPQQAVPTDDDLADLDDHFLLVAHGWLEDEFLYNSLTPGTKETAAFGSWDAYATWFDRDGVDDTQETFWNYKDGITYNTLGNYAVSVLFTQLGTSATEATMFATINGESQGFYSGGYQSDAAPDDYPAGRSFTVADLSDLRAFVGIVPGDQNVTDLTVTGCFVLESGMATGGGWFIPESNAVGLTLDGSKATFGFNAKQKKGQSTGHLEFQYHGDGLNLNSTSYDWVTLATTQVMFEGIGTLNGEPGFRFRVRAVDGDKLGTGIDRFEIRIWTGTDNFDTPTYRAEGDLGGGQIVVRKK